jgi:hypothetical protein
MFADASVAAGQFISLFLAHPNPKLVELDRFPFQMDSPAECLVCQKNKEPEEEAMECERVSLTGHITQFRAYMCSIPATVTNRQCDAPYHPRCLDPPLDSLPEEAWFCPDCEVDSQRTFDDVPLFVAAPGDHDPSPSTPGASSNPAPKRPSNSQGGNSKRLSV